MDALKLHTAPAADPVSVTEVKSYLRIDGSTDDTMLTAFITAATNTIESWIGRKLITQTWTMWKDRFPTQEFMDDRLTDGVTEGRLADYLSPAGAIELPIYPLQTVTHLKTYDDAGTATTMSSSDYIVDAVHEPGRISLKNSTSWPVTYLRPVNGIEIQFVVGYGATGASVPAPILQAIKDLVGKFYMSRGCEDSTIPPTLIALLRPYKVMRLG